MSVDVQRPTPVEIPTVLDLLASWQSDAEPFQLHPGDLGWEQRNGIDQLAAGMRLWRSGAQVLEPLGVHREHRRNGYGRDISLAAADQLRRMGASSATVCTPSANTGGVATYESAGYEPLAQRQDLVSPQRG